MCFSVVIEIVLVVFLLGIIIIGQKIFYLWKILLLVSIASKIKDQPFVGTYISIIVTLIIIL